MPDYMTEAVAQRAREQGALTPALLPMPLWKKVAFFGGGVVGGFLLQRMFSG